MPVGARGIGARSGPCASVEKSGQSSSHEDSGHGTRILAAGGDAAVVDAYVSFNL
jgi:hypothetical protein